MFRNSSWIVVLFASCLALAWQGCSDPNAIGLNLQPASELPGVKTDTLAVNTYTVAEDSLICWSTIKNKLEDPALFIGSTVDNYIGTTHAAFCAQVRVGNTLSSTTFPSGVVIDSVRLCFEYKAIVGAVSDFNKHHIKVYELGESLYTDSTYYTTRTYQKGTLIGQLDIAPKISDSVVIAGINSTPQLRIPLDAVKFGQFLIQGYPASYTDNTTFLNYLKGIVVEDEVDGDGNIVTLKSKSSINKLSVYYKDASGNNTSYDYVIDASSVRMSYFKHSYLPNNIDALMDDPNVIQSMAGLKDCLVIPHLIDLYKNGPVSITGARLTAKVVPGSYSTYNPVHSNLLIYKSDSLGQNNTTLDAQENGSYYGGVYDATNGQYVFNIARNLQQTLKNIVNGGKDYGIFLVASGSTQNAQRTILQGGSSLQLIVTYTKVNP